MLFTCQDVAATVDEEDIVKFTNVVREFDSMTPLVHLFCLQNLNSLAFLLSGFNSVF